MIRLHFVVEGQTEESFVNRMLASYLGHYGIAADARRVETSRRAAKIYRGGLREYHKVRKDLMLWMKEDHNSDAFFTTMFDLYALPADFPQYQEAKKQPSTIERVILLEQAFKEDIQHSRFIPYIQIHEFESLLLSNPNAFDWAFIDHQQAIQNLCSLVVMIS